MVLSSSDEQHSENHSSVKEALPGYFIETNRIVEEVEERENEKDIDRESKKRILKEVEERTDKKDDNREKKKGIVEQPEERTDKEDVNREKKKGIVEEAEERMEEEDVNREKKKGIVEEPKERTKEENANRERDKGIVEKAEERTDKEDVNREKKKGIVEESEERTKEENVNRERNKGIVEKAEERTDKEDVNREKKKGIVEEVGEQRDEEDVSGKVVNMQKKKKKKRKIKKVEGRSDKEDVNREKKKQIVEEVGEQTDEEDVSRKVVNMQKKKRKKRIIKKPEGRTDDDVNRKENNRIVEEVEERKDVEDVNRKNKKLLRETGERTVDEDANRKVLKVQNKNEKKTNGVVEGDEENTDEEDVNKEKERMVKQSEERIEEKTVNREKKKRKVDEVGEQTDEEDVNIKRKKKKRIISDIEERTDEENGKRKRKRMLEVAEERPDNDVTSRKCKKKTEIEYQDQEVEKDEEAVGEEEDLENSIIVPLAKKNEHGGRVYDKVLYCYVCGKTLKEKIFRHIRKRHAKELAQFRCQNSNLDEEQSLVLMKNKGSYIYNVQVYRMKKGTLIVARRPSSPTSYKNYLPCPKCLSFFSSKELWRHKVSCTAIASDESECTKLSKCMLFSSVNESYTEIKEKVVEGGKKDHIYLVVKNDELILAYGSYILENKGMSHKNYISERMRNLGRLLIKFRENTQGDWSLLDLVCGEHFHKVKKAAQRVCGFHENDEREVHANIPSLALKLGHSLKRCALLKQGLGIVQDKPKWEKDGERFHKLYDLHWSNSVNSAALKSLGDSKFTKVTTLPITSDLKKVKDYLVDEITHLTQKLDAEAAIDDWRALAEDTVSRSLIFNKKRCNEVAKITIKEYQERPDFMSGELNDIKRSLTAIERKLCERYA